MSHTLLKLTLATLLGLYGCVHAVAAPDEDKLGKQQGYPVGNSVNWFYDESVRVGSFTHQSEIPNIANGGVNELEPSSRPMRLTVASREPAFRWSQGTERNLTVDDYLNRQRVMGLIIVKDGVIQLERYQYDRKSTHRFLSNSMAKSIAALAVGISLGEGKIRSLEDKAVTYAPEIAGTLYGETTVRNLLRMASGARFTEEYNGKDDFARYTQASRQSGIAAGARVIVDREAPQGIRFNYASAETDMLAAVVRGATGQTLSAYLTPRLWQAIGAETSARWLTDKSGLERASGNFNATLRDFARLGIVMANDGVRPDEPNAKPIVPREFLMEATDWKLSPEAFRPGKATPYYGYGYQFWTFPGERRRFAFLGVYGQVIMVDPGQKLIMVQTTANATAKPGQTTLGRELDALWRGVVNHYGPW